jgi:hypothetical protein
VTKQYESKEVTIKGIASLLTLSQFSLNGREGRMHGTGKRDERWLYIHIINYL